MQFVRWIEVILVVTLVAIVASVSSIARKATTDVRKHSKPKESTFGIEDHERSAAGARDDLSRLEAKLTDLRVELVEKQAEAETKTGERAKADAARQAWIVLSRDLAATRTAFKNEEAALHGAKKKFADAMEAHEWNTGIWSFSIALASALALLGVAFGVLAAMHDTLPVRRSIVAGAAVVALPF
ncbi:MAG TPA: hypothetical protein VF381_08610, partial [Thermoanaerobaculia bacterium]